MDTTGNQAALIEIPRDDGSIDRAIDALDTKITAWVQAVADAQKAIGDAARHAESAAALRAAADVQAVAAQATVPAEAPTREQPPEPQPAAQPPVADGKPGGLRLDHLTAKKPPAEPTRRGIRVYEEEVPETVPIRAQDAGDPDEALLDTLDAKLAKQIRIKRRLCNNTKTIRQLLNETKK